MECVGLVGLVDSVILSMTGHCKKGLGLVSSVSRLSVSRLSVVCLFFS